MPYDVSVIFREDSPLERIEIQISAPERGVQVEELISLQKSILKNAATYVKPGGTLMFSTCTCSDGENMGNVRFLTGECALTPEGFYDELPEAFKCETARDGYMQLVGAGKLTDGFFIGKFRK